MNKGTYKLCGVCSDKALGYNFNAITCESCKAFFRRNAYRSDKLRCPFVNNCRIDVVTRRFCQKCRIDKCFSIGMKKEWILSDDQKRLKRQKVERNKLRKIKINYQELNTKSEYELSSISDTNSNESIYMKKCLDNLINNGYSEFNSNDENKSIIEYKTLDSNFEQYFSKDQLQLLQVFQQIIGSNFTPFHFRSLDPSFELNEIEHSKISELFDAAHFALLFRAFEHPTNKETFLIDLLNGADRSIRKFIKFSKKLKSFRSLCIEDQISLLKGGCIELLILRSVLFYNSESEEYRGLVNVKLDFLKQIKEGIYLSHSKFVSSIEEKWRKDEASIIILLAIILFNPNRPNLKHVEAIRCEQYSYVYLLRRYIASKGMKDCQTQLALIHLLSKMKELNQLSEDYAQNFSQVDPSAAGPLLMEIFAR